jgi:Zn-finger nucleic acid-binding protein
LDKLLERAAIASPVVSQPAPREQRYQKYDDDDKHHGYKHRHQKSWLSDIFD